MNSKKKWTVIVSVIICLALAAVSFFVLAKPLSTPGTYAGIIRSIEDKVETVLKLTASSTAASAGITAIPGDAGTPIAEKLADFSEYGILILCVLYAEKYLLTILGAGVFRFIIPIACILYPLGYFYRFEGLRPTVRKVIFVSLALYFVIPLSVKVSDLIYDTYQASIDSTIVAAEELAEDAGRLEEEEDSQNAFQRAWNSITAGASNLTQQGAEILNRFIESLAVMIVTSCVIPLLVLVFSLWLINQVLGIRVQPPRIPRRRSLHSSGLTHLMLDSAAESDPEEPGTDEE